MMKGFSLLEFLVATTIFLAALLSGYLTLDNQFVLTESILHKTRPEQEANYRLLIFDTLARDASEKLKQDLLFSSAPIFFSDLQFGAGERPDAFSLVRLVGEKILFLRSGNLIEAPLNGPLQIGNTLLLAGLTESLEWDWTYAKIVNITSQSQSRLLQLQYLMPVPKPLLLKGYLLQAEMHGFLYKDQTVYWISPAGQTSPFWDGLEEFSYEWSSPQLKLFWKNAGTQGAFLSTL